MLHPALYAHRAPRKPNAHDTARAAKTAGQSLQEGCGERTRFVRRGGTLFVNAAYVPRVRTSPEGGEESYFVRMQWRAGECLAVEELWVDVDGNVRSATPARFVDLAGEAPVVDETHDEPAGG